MVNAHLIEYVHADQFLRNGGIDVGHGLEDPLAEVAPGIAVAQLYGLMYAGTGP